MKLIVVSLESIRAIFYPASPRGYDSEWLYLFFECQTVTPEHPFKKIEEKMEEVWRLKFKGIDEKLSGSTVAATLDPLVKTAPGQSKRKAAKVAAAASTSIVSDGPKSAEVITLEAKITEQGQAVRGLKAQTPETPELDAQIKAAVDILKALKTDLEKAQ